ncbi:hypothetical protein D9758_010673 [Tetrapyrgos nigripes]|uniref:Xylanolytic transcriptional activator regulatory domain-containing protein n=1 Tax=Tetrapyrgos nigripes TaxID=182062 RepID=A0A8H5LNS9_9AGAR|nr:hypothetical protein D9758_010673 [Tetrapyrgos nigripes]
MNVVGGKYDVRDVSRWLVAIKLNSTRVGDSEMTPNNVCTSCAHLNVECIHSKPQQKRGPKRGSTRTAASHSVQVLVDAILQATADEPFDIPDNKEVIMKILTKLANRVKALERELAKCQRKLNHTSSSNSNHSSPPEYGHSAEPPEREGSYASPPAESDEVETDLSTAIARLTIPDIPKQEHFGESSNVMVVLGIMDHRQELASSFESWRDMYSRIKRQPFWENPSWVVRPVSFFPAFEFPDKKTLRALVDVYFTEVNLYDPLLHRPSFEQSLENGLHLRNAAFGALVLITCARASVYANRQYPRGDARSSGWVWYNQIPLDKFVFNEPLSLYHLQLYCLVIKYLGEIEITLQPDTVWLLTGFAIRLAQGRGIHRRNNLNPEPSVEGELWKRAFWFLTTTDTHLSEYYGRPRATSIQEFDLDPIIECDDEYWLSEVTSQRFKQPVEKPSKVSFWASYVKLMQINVIADETIVRLFSRPYVVHAGLKESQYSIKKPGLNFGLNVLPLHEVVTELDSALNSWVDSVPAHLRWDSPQQTDVFFTQSALLWSTYYSVQIQVHRRFIPQTGYHAESPFPSLSICVNAARLCIRVVEAHLRRRSIAAGHRLLLNLFHSAIILAIHLWHGISTKSFQSNVVQKEIAFIHKCIELLQCYEPRFLLAGRFIDLLNTVMSASHLAPHTPVDGASSVPSASALQAEHPHPQPNLASNLPWSNSGSPGFDIPLYTSDLSVYDSTFLTSSSSYLPSTDGGFMDASSMSLSDTVPGLQQFAQYENLNAAPGHGQGSLAENTLHYAADEHVNGYTIPPQPLQNADLPQWPTNPSEQDWQAFIMNIHQLFSVPHDPSFGSQSEVHDLFDG